MDSMGQLTFIPDTSTVERTKYLFEHGIQTERSTHRIHVDVQYGYVYLFRREDVLSVMPDPVSIVEPVDWIRSGYYLVSFRKDKLATARGIRINHSDIPGCEKIAIPEDLMMNHVYAAVYCETTTSQRGRIGEDITDEMFERGMIRIPGRMTKVIDRDGQIKGVDFVQESILPEVKFDKGCTVKGIFLQTHEWNPNKDH
jgi:hypothetical protein